MFRTPPLQNWLQLRRVLSGPSHLQPTTHASTHLPPVLRPLALTQDSDGNCHDCFATKRLFHRTSLRRARRGADADPAPSFQNKGGPWKRGNYVPESRTFLDQDGRTVTFIDGNKEELVQLITDHGGYLYNSAMKTGVLPKGLSVRKFGEVALKLIEIMWLERPSRNLIRKISKDVDDVFKIGYVISGGKRYIAVREWILTACALDGSPTAVVLITANSLRRRTIPRRSVFTDQITELAQEGYPPAMLMEVIILERQGEYEKAHNLLKDRVIKYLKPMRHQPSMWEDITFGGLLESPWKLFILLKERLGRYEETDALLKMAAINFQDPKYLVDYATVVMQNNNLHLYEECMSQAASAGRKEAIIRLANFYFLTSQGYDFTKKKKDAPKPSSGLLEKLLPFSPSMSPKEYRTRAIDWYDLAFNHDSKTAAFMLSVLLREDGRPEDGLRLLKPAETDPRFKNMAKVLKENYYNKNYDPKIPVKLLLEEV